MSMKGKELLLLMSHSGIEAVFPRRQLFQSARLSKSEKFVILSRVRTVKSLSYAER